MHHQEHVDQPANGAEYASHLEGQAAHILLVEDDLALATLEAGFLTARGFHVVTVHSGEQALQTLNQTLPDLVVLDLELTGTITGHDVLEALRPDPQATSYVPILLTTSAAGAARASIRTQGESKRTLDHLPKPYPMQTLLKRIRRMLQVPS
jgi:CheY-like chemotaxis protein